MPESKAHRDTAEQIADKLGAKYNPGKGPDIKSPRATVEVETPETVSQGPRQLQGSRGPAYIAGTNQEAVKKAVAQTKNTTIGVMDNKGNIVKPSTRKKG